MGSLSNTTKKFPNVPNYHNDHPSLLQDIIKVTQNTMRGKTNNTFTATLAPGVTTTTVDMPRDSIGQDSVIHFMPQTANAAAELASGSMYVSSRVVASGAPDMNSSITITHSNSAQTDRIFGFTVIG